MPLGSNARSNNGWKGLQVFGVEIIKVGEMDSATLPDFDFRHQAQNRNQCSRYVSHLASHNIYH